MLICIIFFFFLIYWLLFFCVDSGRERRCAVDWARDERSGESRQSVSFRYGLTTLACHGGPLVPFVGHQHLIARNSCLGIGPPRNCRQGLNGPRPLPCFRTIFIHFCEDGPLRKFFSFKSLFSYTRHCKVGDCWRRVELSPI